MPPWHGLILILMALAAMEGAVPVLASVTNGPTATTNAPAASQPTPTPTPGPLTDEQNRLLPTTLSAQAETLSQANALYAQAMVQAPGNDAQQTLGLLLRVANLDPHFPGVQIKAANIMLQLGQTEPAFQQLEQAITANPDSIPVQAALAYVQHLRGKVDEAIHLSRVALAKDPTQSVCMRVLLENASEQNDLAGGVLEIEDILKANGRKAPTSAWLTLAKFYIELARSDLHPPTGDIILRTLLPIYQKAADQDPPEIESLTLLADTYRDLGRKREALKTLEQAAMLDPTNADLIVRCGDLEASLNNKANALHDYEAGYALNPSLTGLRELLGRFYLDARRFDEAVRLLQEALAEAPYDPNLLIDLGVAYHGAHQEDQAQDSFRRVFDSDACPPEAYLNLTAFQLADKQIDKALATLAAAHAHFPRSPRVLFYQAIAERYAHNYKAALDALAAMRALGPSAGVLDVNFYLESALNLNFVNRKKEVEATLREGLDHYPDNPDLLNELAYFWADEGKNLSDAASMSRRALALDPDNGALQDTCGWVEFQMGHVHEALPYLQRGAVMTDNDAVVLQHLGDAYLKLGRPADAFVVWRLALKKDPSNHDLIHRIDALPAQAKHVENRSAPKP